MSDSVLRLCLKLSVLFLLASSPKLIGIEPPPNNGVVFGAQLSATELIVGEPLELEVMLQWEEPVEGTTLITSVDFLEILVERDGIKIETSLHSRDHNDHFSNISSWEKETVMLTAQKPEWRKKYQLQFSFPIYRPGRYRITVRWLPEELQPEIQNRMSEKLKHQQVLFLTELNHEYSLASVITCPENEADKAFYLRVTGTECPEGIMSWPGYAMAPNDEEALVNELADSTYAAYILKNRVPDHEDWRCKTATPEDFTRLAFADGPTKEFTPKDERLFKLLEINLRSGNTPQALCSRFWMYYGEQLLLRNRATEAKEAFEQAITSSRQEDSIYLRRSRGFIEVLNSL